MKTKLITNIVLMLFLPAASIIAQEKDTLAADALPNAESLSLY